MSRYQRLAGGRIGLLHFDTAGPVTQRLLCFPHGGGGPHSFAALSAALPAGFAVTAVEPPGRPRTGNNPPNRITALLDIYLEHLPDDLLADCVLLGHSVGGYVATALAARLQDRGRGVRAVVVSAAVPPRFLDPGMPLSAMTDQQRFDWCRGLGTFPVAMPEARALFDLFANSIRADCEAFETAGEAPMAHRAPMLVLGGGADPVCPAEQLRSWTDSHPQAVVRELPGGHMLPQEAAGAVADQIVAFLRPAPAGPRAGSPWRREELRLRGPNGTRRPLPVFVPGRAIAPGQHAEVLTELFTEDAEARAALAEHGIVLARGWHDVDPRTIPALRTPPDVCTDRPGGISPHNELSDTDRWPVRVYFTCVEAAARGGEMVLVDGRALAERVPDDIAEALDLRQVCYARTLSGDARRRTFGTDDRARVTEILAESGAVVEWLPGDRLRILHRRPAFAVDPRSGQRVWFNQIERWHGDAAYGDGEPVPDRDVERIRTTMRELAVTLDCQRGDVLVLDNLTTLHGRTAFQGTPRMLVAMTEPAPTATGSRA